MEGNYTLFYDQFTGVSMEFSINLETKIQLLSQDNFIDLQTSIREKFGADFFSDICDLGRREIFLEVDCGEIIFPNEIKMEAQKIYQYIKTFMKDNL